MSYKRLKWGIRRKKQCTQYYSGGVLSASSCKGTSPALALIVFVFPLIVSYDIFLLCQGFQLYFKFYLQESFRKCCQIYCTKFLS